MSGPGCPYCGACSCDAPENKNNNVESRADHLPIVGDVVHIEGKVNEVGEDGSLAITFSARGSCRFNMWFSPEGVFKRGEHDCKEWGCEARYKLAKARGVLEELMTMAGDAFEQTAMLNLCEESGMAWKNQSDRPLPEDDEIDRAFPTRSGDHDTYAEAARMVGASYTKGALIGLVNMLLHRAKHYKELTEIARLSKRLTLLLADETVQENSIKEELRELLEKVPL
jgi:hypothetical protein